MQHVFIVEDNAIERGGFAAMVEEAGYTVIGLASTGEAAVQKLAELSEKPDVIIMDINLPGMDGLATVEKIKEFCDSPVVIVTGYKPDPSIFMTNSRIFAYIQKPVDPYELITNIKIAYTRSQQSRETEKKLRVKRQELQERKIIEQAKGIIMRMNGCTEQEAMVSLQRKSRNNNCRLIDTARKIVEHSKELYI